VFIVNCEKMFTVDITFTNYL